MGWPVCRDADGSQSVGKSINGEEVDTLLLRPGWCPGRKASRVNKQLLSVPIEEALPAAIAYPHSEP